MVIRFLAKLTESFAAREIGVRTMKRLVVGLLSQLRGVPAESIRKPSRSSSTPASSFSRMRPMSAARLPFGTSRW